MLCCASTPVTAGPILDAEVLTILRRPLTAVRSLGRITAAKNADLGATSIDCVQDRRIRKVNAQ